MENESDWLLTFQDWKGNRPCISLIISFILGYGTPDMFKPVTCKIQGGAEPTDTFQMVTDNIWKKGKISKTVYRYVQVCYLLPTDYKLIF